MLIPCVLHGKFDAVYRVSCVFNCIFYEWEVYGLPEEVLMRASDLNEFIKNDRVIARLRLYRLT